MAFVETSFGSGRAAVQEMKMMMFVNIIHFEKVVKFYVFKINLACSLFLIFEDRFHSFRHIN